jgi:hypothetical protein
VLLTFFAVAARFEGLTRRAASARTAAAGAPVDQPWQRIAWAIGMVVAVGYAGGHLALARGALKPLERAARAHRDYVTGTYPAEALPEGQFRWTARRATFVLEAPTRFLVIRYHVEHPDAGSRPVKLRIFTPCQTLADEFRTDSEVGVRAFELPDGQDRVEFETDVSRTWRPSSVGQADSRELGAAVEAAFVPARSVAGVPDTWVSLKSCGSI